MSGFCLLNITKSGYCENDFKLVYSQYYKKKTKMKIKINKVKNVKILSFLEQFQELLREYSMKNSYIKMMIIN